MSIRVGVTGAAGRMGSEVLRTLVGCEWAEIAFAVDPRAAGKSLSQAIGIEAPSLMVSESLANALERCPTDVLVEFSIPAHATENTMAALSHGVAVVIGTSGVLAADQERIRQACANTPVLLVPNFAIGAVLLMQFAAMAAKWLPHAEVIELHHEGKLDSPSGTALRTAELIAEARSTVPAGRDEIFKVVGARGANVEQVPVHSIRLPGLVAHQEVIFGGVGETLTIRHDSLARSSFMEGVKLAVQHVRSLSGFHVGLDVLLFRSGR